MTDDGRVPGERPVATLAWTRLVVVIAARGLVAMLLGFACWSVGPTLLGWHVTTVVSDSMRPAIAAGDVVAARPTGVENLRPGQVLLAPDPDHEGRLRLHRYASPAPGGGIVTRGDANADDDSSHVAARDVLGVGTLRVPLVGKPAVWAQQEQWAPVLVTAAVVLGAIALSLQSAVRRPGGTGDDRRRSAGEEGRHRGRGSGSQGSRPRRAGTIVTTMMLAGLLVVASPVVFAHAAFSATADAAATFSAASTAAPERLSCTTNLNGTVTISWQHRGDTAGFTVLADGQPRSTLGPDARSTTLSVRSLFSWSRQSITVRSELGGSSWSATSSSVDVRIFSFLGLGSVRCA